MKNGFTLLELLIALAISSLIGAGLFVMFSAIAKVRDSSLTMNDNIVIVEALTSLMNKDMRMMSDTSLALDTSEKNKKLKFTTRNSLRFNKSLPAEVSYYIDDENWLIRREVNTDVLFDMEMRIIPNVTEMEPEFYDDREYKKDLVKNTKLMKIHFIINGEPLTVFTARTMGGI